MITVQIIYASLCVLFAYFNSEWIKADKVIDHKKNGLFHLISWAIAAILFDWRLIIVMPFIGKFVFDTALNIFRKKSLWYIPVPQVKGSVLDKWEYEIFENDGLLPKVLYALIIVLFNMFMHYANQ